MPSASKDAYSFIGCARLVGESPRLKAQSEPRTAALPCLYTFDERCYWLIAGDGALVQSHPDARLCLLSPSDSTVHGM